MREYTTTEIRIAMCSTQLFLKVPRDPRLFRLLERVPRLYGLLFLPLQTKVKAAAASIFIFDLQRDLQRLEIEWASIEKPLFADLANVEVNCYVNSSIQLLDT